jgi:hypothetical protein
METSVAVSADFVSMLSLAEACLHWEEIVVCRRHSDDGITGVKAVAASTNKSAIIQQTLALCANAKFVAAMIVFRVVCERFYFTYTRLLSQWVGCLMSDDA